jgi:hypothetical protein
MTVNERSGMRLSFSTQRRHHEIASLKRARRILRRVRGRGFDHLAFELPDKRSYAKRTSGFRKRGSASSRSTTASAGRCTSPTRTASDRAVLRQPHRSRRRASGEDLGRLGRRGHQAPWRPEPRPEPRPNFDSHRAAPKVRINRSAAVRPRSAQRSADIRQRVREMAVRGTPRGGGKSGIRRAPEERVGLSRMNPEGDSIR